MSRTSLVAVALVALLGLAACGADDNDEPATATPSSAEDRDRYCALTRELDADGEKFFAGLGRDASPKEFEAAERRFVEDSSARLDELQRVAPRQIAADVAKLLAGMRQRAGLQPTITVSEAQASAADERVQAYEKRNCGA